MGAIDLILSTKMSPGRTLSRKAKLLKLCFFLILIAVAYGGGLFNSCKGRRAKKWPLEGVFKKREFIHAIAKYFAPGSADFTVILMLNKKTFGCLRPMLQNVATYFSGDYIKAFANFSTLKATNAEQFSFLCWSQNHLFFGPNSIDENLRLCNVASNAKLPDPYLEELM